MCHTDTSSALPSVLANYESKLRRMTSERDDLLAEVERLRAENVALHSSIASRERCIDRLRLAASPVAVNPAEDAFLNQCEPGEVRT